jgi:hypothetical protein
MSRYPVGILPFIHFVTQTNGSFFYSSGHNNRIPTNTRYKNGWLKGNQMIDSAESCPATSWWKSWIRLIDGLIRTVRLSKMWRQAHKLGILRTVWLSLRGTRCSCIPFLPLSDPTEDKKKQTVDDQVTFATIVTHGCYTRVLRRLQSFRCW